VLGGTSKDAAPQRLAIDDVISMLGSVRGPGDLAPTFAGAVA